MCFSFAFGELEVLAYYSVALALLPTPDASDLLTRYGFTVRYPRFVNLRSPSAYARLPPSPSQLDPRLTRQSSSPPRSPTDTPQIYPPASQAVHDQIRGNCRIVVIHDGFLVVERTSVMVAQTDD